MNRITLIVAACLGLVSASLGAQPEAPGAVPGVSIPSNSDACVGGVVADDGSLETGYGWVPSVVDGRYVQRIRDLDQVTRSFEKVCVCWLRTRDDDTIDFEVVFFEQIFNPDIGRLEPAMEPFAAIPARATGVPSGITGAFYEIDVASVAVPPGESYVGVRWDPSVDSFFFVCADQSPAADPAPVFFIDDRADVWGEALNTPDPVFSGHHAAMIRVVGLGVGPTAVPANDTAGLVVLGGLLALLAVGLLRASHPVN